jgi:hypothetical protein
MLAGAQTGIRDEIEDGRPSDSRRDAGGLESYPLAQEERHAYGCKSDTEGYLEGSGQADARRN